MNRMQKKIFLLLGIIFISIRSLASYSDSTKLFSLSIGTYLVNSESVTYDIYDNEYIDEIPIPVLKLEYKISNNLSLEAYIAYTNMGHRVPLVENSNGMFVLIDSEGVQRLSSNHNNYLLSSNTVFYGMSVKYDLLALITGKNNLRFNFIIYPKIGLVSAKWNELIGIDWVESWNGPFLEYGIGLGGGYLFTKRLGINYNYSIGKYYNNDSSRHYLGLTYRF